MTALDHHTHASPRYSSMPASGEHDLEVTSPENHAHVSMMIGGPCPQRQPSDARQCSAVSFVTRASLRRRLCWLAFAPLPGPPSMRGCSAYAPSPILPRSACLRLILFCTCPSLCVGAMWPMAAWVWRDVRIFFIFFSTLPESRHYYRSRSALPMARSRIVTYVWMYVCMITQPYPQGH